MKSELLLESWRKRLLWRATHRGIKEMDILVGGFARENLSAMMAAELQVFEALLELPDQDLLAYATEQEAVPSGIDGTMLRDLLAFRPS